MEFKFDGNRTDYNKIPEEVTWLLKECLEKGITKINIKVTKGAEKEFIEGLILEVFSESGEEVIFE